MGIVAAPGTDIVWSAKTAFAKDVSSIYSRGGFMKKFRPDFAFKRYSGKRCHNQETLTRYYVQLHDEPPAVNCIMSCGGSTELAVFDGNHWRQLDMDSLIQDSSDYP